MAADQRAFNQYDTPVVRPTRTHTYPQHNPTAGNGAGALIGLLTSLQTPG